MDVALRAPEGLLRLAAGVSPVQADVLQHVRIQRAKVGAGAAALAPGDHGLRQSQNHAGQRMTGQVGEGEAGHDAFSV